MPKIPEKYMLFTSFVRNENGLCKIKSILSKIKIRKFDLLHKKTTVNLCDLGVLLKNSQTFLKKYIKSLNKTSNLIAYF